MASTQNSRLEASLDKLEVKLDKIDDKVDNLDKKLVKIEVNVEKNTEDLAEHIKRTDLNEERILNLENTRTKLEGGGLVLKSIIILVVLPIAIHYFKQLIK